MTDWYDTHWPDEEFNNRKHNIEADGVEAIIEWQETHWIPHDPFYSLRVTFSDDFRHVTLPHAQRAKLATDDSYHITIGNKSAYYRKHNWEKRVRDMRQKYLIPKKHHFKNVRVSNGGSYMLGGPDEVVDDLLGLFQKGTGKDELHISTE
jgi:hypothetical protein